MALLRWLLVSMVLVPFMTGCSLFDSDDEEPATTTPAITPAASVTERAATATPQPATSTPSPTATPVSREPTEAPDGRTGIAEVDEIIETLLSSDAGEIAARFGEGIVGPLTIQALDAEGREVRVPPEEWSATLAGSERSLFTVVEADPKEFPRREYNVVLQQGESDYWNFAVRGSAVVEIVRRGEAVLTYPTGTPGFEFSGQANDFRLPSIERLPERYLVFPPSEYRPGQPAAHRLDVRTGDAGVDNVLAALASDAPYPNSLIGLVDPNAVNRRCEEYPEVLVDVTVNRAFIDSWALDIAGDVVGIYAVVELPEGYQPSGEHLLIVVIRRGQFWWETQGILEAGGEIVGIISPAWPIQDVPLDDGRGGTTTINFRDCLPLPPADYVVPPPDGGVAGLDPMRRSDIALVDAVLDALQAGDGPGLAALADSMKVACVKPGPNFGQGEVGPECRDHEPEGTLVDALLVVVCHGGWVRVDEMHRMTADTRNGLALYAMADPDSIILATPDEFGEQWSISEIGLQSFSRRCGDGHPDRLTGGTDTRYLLPPP